MKNNESGMVLLTVVLLAAIAAILAATLYFASSSQTAGARRHIAIEKAFFIAEAGVERAKAELRQNSGNFNAILLGSDGLPGTADDGILSFGDSVPFGGGAYSVKVVNNTDTDHDPFVDTDKTVVIWSTGTFHNVSRVLEVCVSFSEAINPPLSSDGAIAVYGEHAEIALRGSALVDGNDYSIPVDFFCSGAGCLGAIDATKAPTIGVFSSPTSSVVTVDGSAAILGDPPVSIGGAGIHTEQYWENLANQLMPLATIVVPGGNITGNQTIGTRDNPQIAMLTGNTKITGNVDGAGILIITSEIDVDLTGTFHYEGIILMVGDNSKLDDRGTASIFGSLVILGANGSVRPHGSPQIMYSSEALANLQNLQMPPPSMSIVYWRQVK